MNSFSLTSGLKILAVAVLFVASAPLIFSQSAPGKKNSRPQEHTPTAAPTPKEFTPVYSYTFSNPKFFVTDVLIEHDQSGTGRVVFRKTDYEEDVIEPLALSEAALEKIKTLWEDANFLSSTEDYQSPERDYTHLGTMRLKMSLEGRERTAEFNWTDNKDAKALADEYRKVGNEVIWKFDMNVARQNQPLETPRIMKAIDSYLRRDGIADPTSLIPYLRELKDDERIPLIARNHAERLIASIEKKN